MADHSYLMKPSADTFTIVDREGKKKELAVWRHEAGISRRFAEWENLLVQQGILKVGKVGKARTLLMEGAAFLEFMLDRVRKDPRMLLRWEVLAGLGKHVEVAGTSCQISNCKSLKSVRMNSQLVISVLRNIAYSTCSGDLTASQDVPRWNELKN